MSAIRSGMFVAISSYIDTVVLTSGCGDITFIGSSLRVSARPGDKVSSLTVACCDGESGVIAIAVDDGGIGVRRDSVKRIAYLLEVSRLQDCAWITTDSPFQCSSERMGQVYGEGFVEVQIDGEYYSSRNPQTTPKRQAHYVSDVNLLCRFIAGKASVYEVKAAAQAYKTEQTELERLRTLCDQQTGSLITKQMLLEGLQAQSNEFAFTVARLKENVRIEGRTGADCEEQL